MYSPLNGAEILDVAGDEFAKLLTDQYENNERLQQHLVIHNPKIEISLRITGVSVAQPIEINHTVAVPTVVPADPAEAVSVLTAEPTTIVDVASVVEEPAPDLLRQRIQERPNRKTKKEPASV